MSPWFLCLDKARPRSGHSGNFGNKTELCPADPGLGGGGGSDLAGVEESNVLDGRTIQPSVTETL